MTFPDIRSLTGIPAAMLALAVIAGCSGESQELAATPAGPAQPAAQQVPAEEQGPSFIVDVNGVRLTREDALLEIDNRMQALAGQVQPERLPAMRSRMQNYVVEQFIVRALLLQEADRQDITVTDEQVQDELDRLASQLPEGMTMEQVLARSHGGEEKVREELAVKLRIDQVLSDRIGDLEVSDEEIATFREENKEKLTVDENVRARHILLSVSEEDDEAARAGKKTKAGDLRKQLTEGAKFEELAREHSDCPSARMGGDLGRFRKGQMVKPFEEAAFALEPGQVSEVVETQFGYHIIEVLEHTAEGTLPDENIAEMLQNQRREEALKALVEELRQKASITFGTVPPQAAAPAAPPAVPAP